MQDFIKHEPDKLTNYIEVLEFLKVGEPLHTNIRKAIDNIIVHFEFRKRAENIILVELSAKDVRKYESAAKKLREQKKEIEVLKEEIEKLKQTK